MTKTILTVGVDTASNDTHYEAFSSKASLLDHDIILFKPDMGEFVGGYEDDYLGKPCLTDRKSFAVKEAVEHWRREINQAYGVGKTIIVLLSEKKEIYVANGGKSTSGTGRNQKVTRHVELLSNYQSIPVSLDPTNSSGKAMKLEPRWAEIFGDFWREFEVDLKYKVVLSEKLNGALLATKVGNKTVGLLLRHQSSGGVLLMLPEIDFQKTGFLTSEGNYTKKAIEYSQKFVSNLISFEKSLRASADRSVEPEWALEQRFALAEEKHIRGKLLEIEGRIAKAHLEKEDILRRLDETAKLRGLLYEKGVTLEGCIIEALKLLGFKAQNYKEGSSEFDVVFESVEGRLLGEAEGRDSKAINVDKLRQLSMSIHEDLAREDVSVSAKGVLFGNGFRKIDPSKRDCQFTDKCISASVLSSVALVSTSELFSVAKTICDAQDSELAQKCRERMITQSGLVTFTDLVHNSPEALSELTEIISQPE